MTPYRMPLLQLRFRTKEEAEASAETMTLMMRMLVGTVDVHVHKPPTVATRDRMLGDGEFLATASCEFLALPPLRGLAPTQTKHPRDSFERGVRYSPQPQIMIDLETLGRRPGCPVLSLGAVEMLPTGLGAKFYVNFEIAPQLAAGLVVDPETEQWWNKQSPEAIAALSVNKLHPRDALTEFSAFLGPFGDNVCVWGNGSDFDNAIMSVLYGALNIDQPWKFWNNRCFRTLKSRATWLPMEKTGVQHNALVDAEQQALHAIKVMNELDLW